MRLGGWRGGGGGGGGSTGAPYNLTNTVVLVLVGPLYYNHTTSESSQMCSAIITYTCYHILGVIL